MKVIQGTLNQVKAILTELIAEGKFHMEFMLRGDRAMNDTLALQILFFPERNSDKPIYSLTWLELGYVPFIYLVQIRPSEKILAENLSHMNVLPVMTKALNSGLEKFIEGRFVEAHECGRRKESGKCDFCDPLLSHEALFRDWLNTLIGLYRKLESDFGANAVPRN